MEDIIFRENFNKPLISMGCFIPLRINRPNIEVFRNPQDVPALKKYALLEILNLKAT